MEGWIMNKANQPIFTLRQALSSDFEAIYSLKKVSIRPYVEKIWGWDEDYQYNDFSADFKQIEQFEVIEVDNKFVGFIQTFTHNNTQEIIEIHLYPQYRCQGIGSNIISNLIKCAEGRNIDVSIGCFKENTRAKTLYQRLGFTVIDETDTHFILKY